MHNNENNSKFIGYSNNSLSRQKRQGQEFDGDNCSYCRKSENRDDGISYDIANNDGCAYFLALGTTDCSVRFGKVRTGLKTPKVHGIYNSDLGGLYLCASNGAIEKTAHIPVEFVCAKHYQTKDFFSLIAPFHEKICTGRLAAEEPDLASQFDYYAIRMVNELLSQRPTYR